MIAQNGGRDNAFTAEDYTGYHETVASDRLELVMRLEADRMTGLVLDDKVVLSEREVVLEERRTRIDNEPAALLREQLMRRAVPQRLVAGPDDRLGDRDPAARHRGRAGVLSRMVHAEQRGARRRRRCRDGRGASPGREEFRPDPAPAASRRVRLEEPQHRAAARLEMKSARVAQPSWRRYYLAPSYRAGDTQHAYALQVLAEILGGGAGSRLYQNLVLNDGIALSVGADYSPSALDLTNFSVSATPKAGIAVADLEAAVEASCVESPNRASSPTRSGGQRSACRRPRSTPATASPVRPISSAPRLPSGRRSTTSPRGPTASAR